MCVFSPFISSANSSGTVFPCAWLNLRGFSLTALGQKVSYPCHEEKKDKNSIYGTQSPYYDHGEYPFKFLHVGYILQFTRAWETWGRVICLSQCPCRWTGTPVGISIQPSFEDFVGIVTEIWWSSLFLHNTSKLKVGENIHEGTCYDWRVPVLSRTVRKKYWVMIFTLYCYHSCGVVLRSWGILLQAPTCGLYLGDNLVR
jgi:hypothetical protein